MYKRQDIECLVIPEQLGLHQLGWSRTAVAFDIVKGAGPGRLLPKGLIQAAVRFAQGDVGPAADIMGRVEINNGLMNRWQHGGFLLDAHGWAYLPYDCMQSGRGCQSIG